MPAPMEHAGDHSAADLGFRGANYGVADPKSFVTKVGGTFGLPLGPQGAIVTNEGLGWDSPSYKWNHPGGRWHGWGGGSSKWYC